MLRNSERLLPLMPFRRTNQFNMVTMQKKIVWTASQPMARAKPFPMTMRGNYLQKGAQVIRLI